MQLSMRALVVRCTAELKCYADTFSSPNVMSSTHSMNSIFPSCFDGKLASLMQHDNGIGSDDHA